MTGAPWARALSKGDVSKPDDRLVRGTARTGSPRRGDIVKFCGQAFGDIFNARVFQFFGEALRQAGILILGSAMVIWGMVFILGLDLRDRGRLLQPLGRRARLRRRLHRLV